LDAQRESAEALIESQKSEGWICLPEHYDDGGFTGSNMERPAMKRLMTDIEAEKIDCVVVYKVDRLSRSLMDFARIMETLEKQTTSFVSVTQQFNTTHSMGRLTLNILLSFAQFEREITSERTRDKKIAARKKGKWTGGLPTLGYDLDPRGGRLIVNHEEAFLVRTAFELYLDHQSLRVTADELNRRGWTTKRFISKRDKVHGGVPFKKNILQRILTNPTYLGKVQFDGEFYEGEHQAIVEETKWQQVQEILNRNRLDRGKTVRNKYGALLKGLLYCKPCQSPMVHSISVKNENIFYRYYVCSKAQVNGWHSCSTKSVIATEIEEFVVDRIRHIGRDNDLVAETLKQVRGRVQNGAERLTSELWVVNEEIKNNVCESDRLMNDSAQHLDGKTRTSGRLAELENQIDLGRQRANEIREKIDNLEFKPVDKIELSTELADFDSIWESLLPRERTRLIHLLIKRLDYDGAEGTMRITFHQTEIKTLVEGALVE